MRLAGSITKFLKTASIVAIVALLIVVTYLLLRKKGGNDVLYQIPGNATSVLVVDIRALSAKLLLGDMGRSLKIGANITNFLPDTLKDIDWGSAGLGLPSKAVFFTVEDASQAMVLANFILPVANAKKFGLFMERLGKKLTFDVHQQSNVAWAHCSKPGILLAWNETFIAGMLTRDQGYLKQLMQVLSTQKGQSLMADTSFSRAAAHQCDVFLYSKPYRYHPWKKWGTFASEINYVTSFLDFNDGALDIRAEINTKKGALLGEIFTGAKKEMYRLATPAQPIINLLIHVNPAAASEFYKKYNLFTIKTSVLPGPDAWDGSLHASFYGIKTIEQAYLTYEYDDDFNKIEKKNIGKQTVYDVQAVAGLNKRAADSLDKQTASQKQTGLEGNLAIEKETNRLIVYNKQFGKPQTTQQIIKNAIEIEVNYKELSPILKGLGMMNIQTRWLDSIACHKLSFKVNKPNHIHITGKVYIGSQDKNSFYSILEKGNVLIGQNDTSQMRH